ncbi:MAG: class I SAM-dependent methyltransferase [Solirubrobacteraceae bacterium]
MRRSSGIIGTSRYEAADAYARLIAPRFHPVAERLIERSAPSSGDQVLELGAGTGCLTRLVAPLLCPTGHLLATDRSDQMLTIAQRDLPRTVVTFALVDYTAPLPFLDTQFDLALSQFSYVQDDVRSVREVHRVLRHGGRLALAMWGPSYGETKLHNSVRKQLGLPPVPPARPDLVVRRLHGAGFTNVRRDDLDITARFDIGGDYLAYRRAFGTPSDPAAQRDNERILAALRCRVERLAPAGTPLDLQWTVTFITADRRKRR